MTEVTKLPSSDGVLLHTERTLPESSEAGAAPCIVFSCGYATTHENWRAQVQPLVQAGWQVVLWDHRGHGLSEAPTEASSYTMELVVDDLEAVANFASPDAPLVLAGLSFGGLASLHFAIRAPERVRALVLAGSGPGFKNPEAAAGWAAQTERTASYLEERGLQAFVDGKAGVTCIGADRESPSARSAAAAIVAQNVPGLAAFGRNVTGLAPSVIDDLARITAASLVIVGSNDKAFRRAAEVMAAKLPAAEHIVIDGAGHVLNIEKPEAFDAALLEFLARV